MHIFSFFLHFALSGLGQNFVIPFKAQGVALGRFFVPLQGIQMYVL